jgi:hypothetical protein
MREFSLSPFSEMIQFAQLGMAFENHELSLEVTKCRVFILVFSSIAEGREKNFLFWFWKQ